MIDHNDQTPETATQPEPPEDDNPRGAMPDDSYERISVDQLSPSERAAFEAIQQAKRGQQPPQQEA